MREILYLSHDSLLEGVGASQVLSYMRKVQQFIPVTIISFEKVLPNELQINEVQREGLKWMPLPFGSFGIMGGIGRVVRMWLKVERSKIIHARSTLPALAAMLRFPRSWIWDCRSLQADQRRALSESNVLTAQFLIMRGIEYLLAKKASAIIVITHAVVPIFIGRFNIKESKIRIITTCVDIEKFRDVPFKRTKEIKILLAGTFSAAYDLDLINKIIERLKELRRVKITIATSLGSTDLWKKINYDLVTSVLHNEMPNLIQEHDIGVSIWKNDLGISLASVASTKTAEFLACGRPIIINSLQGDFGTIVGNEKSGVVTQGSSPSEIHDYANKILELIDDERTVSRCRNLAVREFNLDMAVVKLIHMYQEI